MTYKEAFVELTKQINSGLKASSQRTSEGRFFEGAQFAYWELSNSAFNLESEIDGIEEEEP